MITIRLNSANYLTAVRATLDMTGQKRQRSSRRDSSREKPGRAPAEETTARPPSSRRGALPLKAVLGSTARRGGIGTYPRADCFVQPLLAESGLCRFQYGPHVCVLVGARRECGPQSIAEKGPFLSKVAPSLAARSPLRGAPNVSLASAPLVFLPTDHACS